MDHDCIIIGFVGIDQYDIILYLARSLSHLKKKVMLVDKADTGALTACIPCPAGMGEVIIDYRGVYYLNSGDYKELVREGIEARDFQYVLIDYGYSLSEEEAAGLNQIIYATDLQKHNVDRLIPLAAYQNNKKKLVIRDVVGYRYRPEYIRNELGSVEIPAEDTHIIYLDEVDTKCKLKCQNEIAFSFRKLSVPARNTVKGLLAGIIPGGNSKALATAYRKAEKGD